jgi:hypothetical protein
VTCSIEDQSARKRSLSRDIHRKDGAIEISQIRIILRRAGFFFGISLMDGDQHRATNIDMMAAGLIVF